LGGIIVLFDEDEMIRINTFDWNKEFPEIFQGDNPGFDVVIGNQPYRAWFQTEEDKYFSRYYKVFGGVKDVYTCFIEKGLNILKQFGKLSFIIPSAWIGGPQYAKLRSLLLLKQVDTLILLPFAVFSNAYVDTAIIVLSNQTIKDSHSVQTYIFGKRDRLNQILISSTQYKSVKQHDWQVIEGSKFILNPEAIRITHTLNANCQEIIKDVALMKRGVLFDKSLLTNMQKSDIYYRYFEGNIYRYQINIIADRWIEFSDKMKERPKEISWFKDPRILLRRLVNRRQRLMSTLTTEPFITNKNIYTIKVKNNNLDILVLLGILNSKLISFLYLQQVTQATKDDFPQVTIKDVLSLPFPSITAITIKQEKMVVFLYS